MSTQTVRVSSNQTSTSATLADVTGLTFTVNAGITYQFTFPILFTIFNQLSTEGIQLGLTFPAATIVSAVVRIPRPGSGTAAESQGYITSSGDSVSSGILTFNNYIAFIEGTIKPSTSGTLQVQFAKLDAGSVSATIQANSAGILKVA